MYENKYGADYIKLKLNSEDIKWMLVNFHLIWVI